MNISRAVTLAVAWTWLLLLSVLPLCIILVMALARDSDSIPPFRFAADPSNLISAATERHYLTAIWLSLRTAAISTVICLVGGYPMALAIARVTERWRSALLLALMLQ